MKMEINLKLLLKNMHNMHLCLTGSAVILTILVADLLVVSVQSQISQPKWLWNCSSYWNVYLCDRNSSNCQAKINLGEPCCLAHWVEGKKFLCVNKTSTHKDISKCLRPVGLEGSSCKSFNGRILSTVDVLTEFHCMDLCIRNLRCVAFNIFKSTDEPRPCQLLESDTQSSDKNCLENYIGKKVDREAFYKSYLSPECRGQDVT